MIMAAALVPILLAVGIGVDLSRTYTAKSRLQSACDAGVLASRQIMQGTLWDDNKDRKEGEKFFDFNFPQGSYGATNLSRSFMQSTEDSAEVKGRASARIPTLLMNIFGYDHMDVAVDCDAKRDLGNNDIMLVLDVTGSMKCAPGQGSCSKMPTNSKIKYLQDGALSLYNAIGTQSGARTRYGFVPYSQNVNIGNLLSAKDLRDTQTALSYTKSGNSYSYSTATVTPFNTKLPLPAASSSVVRWTDKANFLANADACVEERNSVGKTNILNTVSVDDIDKFATAASPSNDPLKFGVYSPWVQYGVIDTPAFLYGEFTHGGRSYEHACPDKVSNLKSYSNVSSFSTALKAATAKVAGYTYHDIGMMWGLRLMSRNGMNAAEHDEYFNNIPVNQHIIFMTDGQFQTADTNYTAYGQSRLNRLNGGYKVSTHKERFLAICEIAKNNKGITVWVIAVDVPGGEFTQCATSSAHVHESNGSDLSEVFKRIGQGIGNLRLTR